MVIGLQTLLVIFGIGSVIRKITILLSSHVRQLMAMVVVLVKQNLPLNFEVKPLFRSDSLPQKAIQSTLWMIYVLISGVAATILKVSMKRLHRGHTVFIFWSLGDSYLLSEHCYYWCFIACIISETNETNDVKTITSCAPLEHDKTTFIQSKLFALYFSAFILLLLDTKYCI